MTIQNKYCSDNAKIDFDMIIYTIGSYHYNWHKEIELFWLLKGQVNINIEGEIFSLTEDDLIIIDSNLGHATLALQADSIAMRIHVHPDFFAQQGVDVSKGRFILNSALERQHPAYGKLRYELAKLYLCFSEKESPFQIHAIFYSIAEKMMDFHDTVNTAVKAHDFSEEVKKRAVQEQRAEIIRKVVRFIEKNYRKDITLEDLAENFNYSSSYLSKLFKSELGINFYEYMTRHRLHHTVKGLNSDAKIADIAFEHGFNDLRAFNKMFKKHFGLTPSEYRLQLNANSPDLMNQFKKAMSSDQISLIHSKFETIKKNYENEQLLDNPCHDCLSKKYEEKYFTLISNLKEITTEQD